MTQEAFPLRRGAQYGLLQPTFSWSVPNTGYHVLTGVNDSGKSAILQLITLTGLQTAGFGVSKVVLIPTDREFVQATTEVGGRTLENYNQQVTPNLNNGPTSFDNFMPPYRNELVRLLLTHYDQMEQVPRFNEFLSRIGFSKIRLPQQQMRLEDVAISLHGSGVRGVAAILAALTDPQLQIICIDEPELSLEPRLQKSLRDVLIEQGTDRLIIVATHSHLFLNREESQLDHNHVVVRDGDQVAIKDVATQEELYDITFKLLGMDTEDLFFPGNYLITEGASDQVICEAIKRLDNVPKPKVKVLAAGGVTKVNVTLTSILNSLKPLVTSDSPYAKRVVALVDQADPSEKTQLDGLQEILGDRLVILPDGSIEEYLPDDLYARAGRNKTADLAEIQKLRRAGDHKGLGDLKRQLSNGIADILTIDDLERLPVLRDAVSKAANWHQEAAEELTVTAAATEP